MAFTIINADVIEGLRSLPDASVHTIVTSPPYWGLRQYAGVAPREWADGSRCVFGLEPTIDLYIDHLVTIFRELKRVLHPSGTFYLNIGDCYNHAGPQPSTGIHKRNDVPLPNTFKRPKARYDGFNLKPVDCAWLAALIDGEGCIQAHRQTYKNPGRTETFQVDVSVGMMDPDMVQKAHTMTGLGHCEQQNRGVWDWGVRGQQAATLLRQVYPFLTIKKRQAALGIMLADDLAERNFNRGNPVTQEAIDYRESLKHAIHCLNQREDLPPGIEIKEPQPVAMKQSGKNLSMIPARAALALQDDGWILRNDIIWAKGLSFCPTYSGSVMPESIRDRAIWSHEHLYHFALKDAYFYDIDGCREPYAEGSKERYQYAFGGKKSAQLLAEGRVRVVGFRPYRGQAIKEYDAAGVQNPSDVKRRVMESMEAGVGRNLRNVWVIPKEPLKEAHFAAFPTKLVEPVIKLGTSEHGCCPACLDPWERVTHREEVPEHIRKAFEDARTATVADTGRTDGHTQRKPNYRRKVLGVGWRPTCVCEPHNPIPCTVLDPFCGSGRAGIVAVRQGRNFIGIDASREYCAIANRVIGEVHV